jgi:hypothetical protein
MTTTLRPERNPEAEVDVQQKLDRPQHPVQLHAFDAQLAAFVRANAQKDSFVALFLQIGKGKVLTRAVCSRDFHAERLNRGDFRTDDFSRQPIFGHARAPTFRRPGSGPRILSGKNPTKPIRARRKARPDLRQ